MTDKFLALKQKDRKDYMCTFKTKCAKLNIVVKYMREQCQGKEA